MIKYQTCNVGHEAIKYLRQGHGEPLFFLHGFGLQAHNYSALLRELAQTYEVFAPDLYGIHYLKRQPTSLQQFAELTFDFCRALTTQSFYLCGHSIGGAVAFQMGALSSGPRAIVAINPALPVNYRQLGFIARAGYKSLIQSLGLVGGLPAALFANRIRLPYAVNMLRNLDAAFLVLRELADFDLSGLRVPQPAAVLFGERDEFFALDEPTERRLHGAFQHLAIKRLPQYNHDWPVYEHEAAAAEVLAAIKRQLSIHPIDRHFGS